LRWAMWPAPRCTRWKPRPLRAAST
jgi:hypothetical protein